MYFVKNNPFLSFVIIAMWIFLLCLSISEKGFFIEHITEAIGTTIFFIGIGTLITINKEKMRTKGEKKQNILEKIDESEENNIKNNRSNKGKIFLKRYIISIAIVSIIVTSAAFYIRKLEFSFLDFFATVIGGIIIQIIFFGAIGIVVETAIDYRKDCKKYGVLKATIWLVVMILMVALCIYNKDAKWFRK